MGSRSSWYSDGSVFAVSCDPPTFGRRERKTYGARPNQESFDLAVVEFDDDGAHADPHQLTALTECIDKAHEQNGNGAVVVAFIHGWHHDARWEDRHFEGFRRVLASLALRESERVAKTPFGRRVVGVYLAWRGDPACLSARWCKPWLTSLAFFNRYNTAKRIGDGGALRATIRAIVKCTKDRGQGRPESPLALIGHSMGGLMLESAFLALLAGGDPALGAAAPPSNRVAQVTRDGQPVSFPDVMIVLNSAADSRITRRIVSELEQQKLQKAASSGGISYSPPLLVSATATADLATKVIWRLAPLNFWRKTGGHDARLFTHDFAKPTMSGAICERKLGVLDFGQSWSCLRLPTSNGAAPTFPIDLPNRERSATHDGRDHTRYELTSRDEAVAKVAWVFQLPPDISAGHNDIFNTRSRLLIQALMQISGATMSLAESWIENFEPL